MLSFLRSCPVPEDHERGLPGIGGGVPTGRLRRREFGAVLITSQAAGRWSSAVLQALDESYRTDTVYSAMFAAEGEPDFAIFVPGP